MFHALDIAITQIGVFEETGHNDGVPAERYMRGDKLAWCAGFVLYCFDVSDDPDVPGNYWKLRAVASLEENLRGRGMLIGHAVRPAPNDIIFFANRGRSDAKAGGRHVGIVEKVEGAYVHTIEGNLSNKVKRAKHPLGSKRITAYGRITPTPDVYA